MSATEPDPKRTRGKKRRPGAPSTITVSAQIAEMIDELQAHWTDETGFDVDRQQVLARAVRTAYLAAGLPAGERTS